MKLISIVSVVSLISFVSFAQTDQQQAMIILTDIQTKLSNGTTAEATRNGILRTFLLRMPLFVLQEAQTNIDNNIAALPTPTPSSTPEGP